jgi:2'-5' RNA ligase
MENISPDNKTYYKPHGLFEYLLIVYPGKEVYDKVMEEKQYFTSSYQQAVAVKTKPHITVSTFLAWDNMEDTLIRRLQHIVKEQRSFYVTLNNYSGFPSHTVFIRVQDPAPFKELALRLNAITPYIKEHSCTPARFMHYPHISIARRLPAAVYENAIKDYSEKDFNASFNVTELVLLRRQHQHDQCKEVGVFRLQPNEYNN